MLKALERDVSFRTVQPLSFIYDEAEESGRKLQAVYGDIVEFNSTYSVFQPKFDIAPGSHHAFKW